MMSRKKKSRLRYLGLTAAFVITTGLSSAANAWTPSNGLSCQNKWYEMGLLELAYCHPWSS